MSLLGSLGASAARNIIGRAISKGIQNRIGATQKENNAYSYAEMLYANDVSNNFAGNANRVAQENAETAFERQQMMNREAMAFNASEAEKAREYDERMSNTAYQRAMADMKAAGLNPILAYSQGGAAFSGGQAASFGGSTAQSATTFMADPQRQVIDQSSTRELKKTRMQVVGNLLDTFINSASRLEAARLQAINRTDISVGTFGDIARALVPFVGG